MRMNSASPRPAFRVRAHSRGFSLIELMVAMVVGLIVTGAVVAFAVSSLNTNSEFIQSTRLTQELRSALDYSSRELRRAGYDENSMASYVQRAGGAGVVSASPFSLLQVLDGGTDSSCVVYAYDRDAGQPGQVDATRGEVRALRRASRTVAGRTVGVLEVGESAAGVNPTCDGGSPDYTKYPATCASGWCALTDPRALDLTSFRVAYLPDEVSTGGSGVQPLTIRQLELSVAGRLIAKPDVTRRMDTRVRVRADCLRKAIDCVAAPVGT